MRIYLNGLCAAGVNHFNDILLVFTHVNGTTSQMTSLTVVDRLLIKALHIQKGWRCASNDCGISSQTVKTMHFFMHERTYEQPFLVTMSTSTNKHRYKIKLLGLLLPPPWRKNLREISNFIVKILLYFICIVSLMTNT